MAIIAIFGISWMSTGTQSISFLGFIWTSPAPLTLANFSGAFSAVLLFKFLSEAFNWAFTETVSASAASRRLYKIIYE